MIHGSVRVPGALNAPRRPAPGHGRVPCRRPRRPIAPRKKRSSSFMDKLFGAGGPKRAPQTTVAQFGSESIANGGTQAYPIAMDGDTDRPDQRAGGQLSVQPGICRVSLDNGQVWQQTAAAIRSAVCRGRPCLQSPIIGRGSAGSYDMKLSHFARTLPVRRIQLAWCLWMRCGGAY